MAHEPARARILVVDDEAVLQLLVRGWLGQEHDLFEAHDGAEALAALDRVEPDLVLLDVVMPGASGLEVCAEIKRRRADGPLLPVLLLTALGDRDHVRAGLRAGADDFIAKPCDADELRLRVRAFLRTRRQDLLIRRQLAELRRISALKDDLVALVAHDLRSPLGTVLSLVRTAREDLQHPDVPQDLDDALVAAERVREITEDLLQVRLLEHGEYAPARAPVCAGDLVRHAVEPLRPQAEARGIAVQVEVEGDPRFELDGRLVGRAVQNLLANALKYGPANGRVEVRVGHAGADLVLEVADRGPGLPAELRAGGFRELTDEERQRDPRRGYGLGLQLVQLVARAHGGEVTALERPGGGALLRLRLAPPAPSCGAPPPSHGGVGLPAARAAAAG
jgi:signal transduction histidine kinase